MTARVRYVLLAAGVLLIGVASSVAIVIVTSGPATVVRTGPVLSGRPPADATPAVAPGQPDPDAANTAEFGLRARIEESRAAFRALRSGYQEARADPRGKARIEKALATLWKPGSHMCNCRGGVCRIEPPPLEKDRDWQRALTEAAALKGVAERIAFDPDGGEVAAYVQLTAEVASEAESVLADAAERIAGSEDLSLCLPRGEAAEIRLQVRGAKITWRMDAEHERDVLDCISRQVSDAVGTLSVPPSSREAERVIRVERR